MKEYVTRCGSWPVFAGTSTANSSTPLEGLDHFWEASWTFHLPGKSSWSTTRWDFVLEFFRRSSQVPL